MAQDAGERLQHFQAVVALASELDLAMLHPPMASSSPTPLSTISSWDSERLRRISRWRASENPGKDLVRAYSKVVLALEELDDCASRISLHAGTGVPPVSIALPQQGSSSVVLKSALKSRSSSTEEAVALGRAPRRSRWATGKLGGFAFPAPPAWLRDILSAWGTALSCMARISVFCLTWAPWLILIGSAILFFSEPSLVLRLALRLIGVIPNLLREYVRFLSTPSPGIAERPEFASAFLPNPQPAPLIGQPDPALTGHCIVAAESDTSALWLAAGQGGAASMYLLAQRYGWLR